MLFRSPLVDGVEEDTALRRAMRLGTAVEAIAQVSIVRGQLVLRRLSRTRRYSLGGRAVVAGGRGQREREGRKSLLGAEISQMTSLNLQPGAEGDMQHPWCMQCMQ